MSSDATLLIRSTYFPFRFNPIIRSKPWLSLHESLAYITLSINSRGKSALDGNNKITLLYNATSLVAPITIQK